MRNKNAPDRSTSLQIASTPQEQLFFLNQFGSIYFWLHVFAALMLCLLLWTKVAAGSTVIFVWFSAIVLLAIGYWLINNKLTHGKLIEKHLKHYRLINISICLVWGSSGLLLFSHDPLTQTIHLCILLVITLSIWPMSIISTKEFYIQLTLLLAPITLMLALQQDLKINLLCFVTLAFVTVIVVMTKILGHILENFFNKEQSLIDKVSLDPVTQLMSSRHFDRTFKREWQRAARDQQSLSLIMMEVDDFRKIEGVLDIEEVRNYLKSVAACLQATVQRSSDTLAHYDYINANFVALLPGTSLEAATGMAKRLQLKIEEAALPNPLTENQIITMSVGVSSSKPAMSANNKHAHALSQDPAYPANLLKNAMQALRESQQ